MILNYIEPPEDPPEDTYDVVDCFYCNGEGCDACDGDGYIIKSLKPEYDFDYFEYYL